MRVLVVQNFDGTPLGQLSTALEEAGAQVEFLRPHHGDALPETIGDFSGMIVLGGGQNALADDAHPYFPKLLQLMRGFTDADRSVLGICLGSQLLARAYNAENIIGGASEFGWHKVSLTEDGRDDPLFLGVPSEFPIFHWHDDTFILPRGATRLAGNITTHNQAFRLGRAAYGVQFHFEANVPVVEHWNEEFSEWLARSQPDWPKRYPQEAARHAETADAVGLKMARNWVATIRSA